MAQYMKTLITTCPAVVMFATTGLSQEPSDSRTKDGDVSRKRQDTGIWKPMVLEGRELLPALRTREADEPAWHVRPGFCASKKP
ncbi:MAG TPA: hypothetical protein DDW52_29815 [Planctomycetaceae bacterium]|nr:hypothetical protein [Planctomycetaceae bacterium]